MDFEEIKKLIQSKPDELRNRSKDEIHEGYKKLMVHILFDFYLHCSTRDEIFDNHLELLEFTMEWVDKNIKPARPHWNPGDSAI